MKTKIFLLATTLLLSFGVDVNAQKKDDKKESVEFDVSMTCDNCKKRIERTVSFEKGVTDMKVDLPEKTVFIEYRKDKTNSDKLQKVIEKLGYTVTLHNEKKEEAKAE